MEGDQLMLLQLNNVSGGYHQSDIVKGISFGLEKGDILCVAGPNGCGKTTLFRLILGSLSLSSGSIRINGEETVSFSPNELAQKIAYIPQQHTPIFSYTALDIVLMGRTSYLSTFEAPSETDYRLAFSALEKLKIEYLANQSYDALSGGQRQMVIIARAICQSASILVMDEPSANLDYANQQALLDILKDLSKEGYGIILSTHSPEHPLSFGNKVLLMKDGKASVFGNPQDCITEELLQEVYDIEMEIHHFVDKYGKQHRICFPISNK